MKKSELEEEKINEKKPVKLEKDFVLVKIDKNRILYAGHVSKNKGEMTEIEVIEIENNFEKIKTVYTATKGILDSKTNRWNLENIKKYDSETNKTTQINSNDYNFVMKIDDVLADPVVAKNLTMRELREKIVYFNRVGADTVNLLIDFYYRIAFSFASFVMAFIGLSLGSRYVRGGAAVNIGLSVIIGYSYYGFSTILRSIAGSKTIPIYLACFIPLIIYFAIGIKLLKNAEH